MHTHQGYARYVSVRFAKETEADTKRALLFQLLPGALATRPRAVLPTTDCSVARYPCGHNLSPPKIFIDAGLALCPCDSRMFKARWGRSAKQWLKRTREQKIPEDMWMNNKSLLGCQWAPLFSNTPGACLLRQRGADMC